MDSEELKKVISKRIREKGIYPSDEQLNQYTQCLLSKRFTNNLLSVAAGVVAFVTLPVKASTPLNYYLKKSLYSTCVIGAVSMFNQIGAMMSCAPIVKISLNSETDNPPQGESHESFEPSTVKPLDFTLGISSSDFSNDSSGLDRPEDSQESQDKVGYGKKRVTYDDLWRQHKNTSQSRTEPKPYGSEGADVESTVDSGEPSWEKRKIRTNKYGDPLE